MNIEGTRVLVLGGFGLVGLAVCRELLAKKPGEIRIHSLRLEEAEEARRQLLPEAGETAISVSAARRSPRRSSPPPRSPGSTSATARSTAAASPSAGSRRVRGRSARPSRPSTPAPSRAGTLVPGSRRKTMSSGSTRRSTRSPMTSTARTAASTRMACGQREAAAVELDEVLEAAYIDTGENGIFSLEEFAALTTAEQMEFVTPEEIATYLCFEIEGGNTGHDIINALDNAVVGPSYRAGLLRHWALERMNELERRQGTSSVAFEMLGPPRNSKLLFEAHLLRLAFATMNAVREASPEEVEKALDELVRRRPRVADEVAAVGIPILLASGEIVRGPRVIVPADAEEEPVAEHLETWVHDGWVDLRRENCARWIDRFCKIHREIESIPAGDTSSRHLRGPRFWDEEHKIQPGKVVGWILSEEEHGARFKR